MSSIEPAADIDSPAMLTSRYLIRPETDQHSIDGVSASLRRIHLGRWFVSFRRHALPDSSIADDDIVFQSEEFFKRHYREFGTSLRLNPGQVIFGVTLEWLQLPFRKTTAITPNGPADSTGLTVSIPTQVPPGFSGCLTLEIFNPTSAVIDLKPGQSIGNLSFTLYSVNDADGESGVDVSADRRIHCRRPHLDPQYCRQLMEKHFLSGS
jgi:dCTP deaminase